VTRIIPVLAIGGIAGLSALGADFLDASSHVSLGSALAVAGVIMPAMWWFGRKFQEIEDRDKSVHTALETTSGSWELRFATLERRIDALTCQKPDCPAFENKPSPSP
jgi:ABC-type transport system involved in cytochrome bd biosynthesis fused ATPase/permease subunit